MEKQQDNPNPEALSWLLEMEMVSSPYVLNSIILNIFAQVKAIKDAEFVIDENRKAILIYLKLGWFHQKFKSKEIEGQVTEMLDQILPTFRKRVVFDRTILEKALVIMKNKEKPYERKAKETSAPATPVNQDDGRSAGVPD
jgi:hypothetical protein